MMQGIFTAITYLCQATIFLLFAYKEWLYMSQSFWNFINPLGHIVVVFSILGEPLFWGASVMGFFSLYIANAIGEKETQTKEYLDYYELENTVENEFSDGKCRAITKKGTPCKNRATENGYCRIHGGV
jgi:hypothetical protein